MPSAIALALQELKKKAVHVGRHTQKRRDFFLIGNNEMKGSNNDGGRKRLKGLSILIKFN